MFVARFFKTMHFYAPQMLLKFLKLSIRQMMRVIPNSPIYVSLLTLSKSFRGLQKWRRFSKHPSRLSFNPLPSPFSPQLIPFLSPNVFESLPPSEWHFPSPLLGGRRLTLGERLNSTSYMGRPDGAREHVQSRESREKQSAREHGKSGECARTLLEWVYISSQWVTSIWLCWPKLRAGNWQDEFDLRAVALRNGDW